MGANWLRQIRSCGRNANEVTFKNGHTGIEFAMPGGYTGIIDCDSDSCFIQELRDECKRLTQRYSIHDVHVFSETGFICIKEGGISSLSLASVMTGMEAWLKGYHTFKSTSRFPSSWAKALS